MPLPLPLAPPVTVIHPSLLTAVQPHPAPAVTLTLPLPPPAATLALVGSIEYEHGVTAARAAAALIRP